MTAVPYAAFERVASKGAANGYAGLGADIKIPSALLRGDPYLTPEDHSTPAPGNDSALDTAALQAIAATGLDILLKKGKTYLVDASINLAARSQKLVGGGKLKRRAQISTTTTDAITSGVTTQVTVADATGFRAGQTYVAEKAGTYDTTAREVQAIAGNQITFTTALGITSASGTVNIRLGFPVVVLSGQDTVVEGVEIDGNKSNWTWARWDHSIAIKMAGGSHGAIAAYNYIHDAPGEGILPIDSTAHRVIGNRLQDLNGNGIHMGSVSGVGEYQPVIAFNWIKTCNLDTSVGHADGCIVWSNQIYDAVCVGNHCEAGLSGFGSIDYAENKDVTIVGNTVRNCTTPFEGDSTTLDTVASSVTITGNRFYSSGTAKIISQNASTVYSPRWLLHGNLFVDTLLQVQNAEDVDVVGNEFIANDTTSTVVKVIGTTTTGCKNVNVSANVVRGGSVGILLQNFLTNVRVANNTVSGQNSRGIQMQTSCGGPGIVIQGNSVANDSTALTSYIGIVCTGGLSGGESGRLIGNTVKLVKGTRCINVENGDRGVIMGNVLEGVVTTAGISVAAAAAPCTNALVKGNAHRISGGGSGIVDNSTTAVQAENTAF